MAERPRNVEAGRKAPTPETAKAVRKETLKPWVRRYVGTLEAQARELKSREKELTSHELKHLLELTARMKNVLETGEVPVEVREQARELLRSAKETVRGIKSTDECVSFITALAEIAEAEAVTGFEPSMTLGEAMAAALNIGKEEGQPRSLLFADIAKAEAVAGLDPSQTFEMAKTCAREEDYFSVSYMGYIAEIEAASGLDSTKTLEEVRRMAKRTSIPGLPDILQADFKNRDLEGVARAEVAAGHFEDAKQAAQGITDKEFRVREFTLIAKAEAVAGLDPTATIDAAKQVALAMEKEGRPYRLSDIAIAEAHIGRLEQARRTAEQIEVEDSRVNALVAIATAETASGIDPSKTLEEARRFAQRIPDETGRINALIKIAVAENTAGFDASKTRQEAMRMAEQIRESFASAHAFSEIAKAEAAAGHFPEAKQIAKDFVQDFHSSYYATALAAIARAEAAAAVRVMAGL